MARRSLSARSGHTVLVVDDQQEILSSVRQLLEREGHEVLTAESGECALALFKQRDIHLCLVDYFMPCMTGDQVVREIRSIDPLVQIILQTGYSGEKPAREMLAHLDIQGYHDKADGPEKLLQWIDVGLKAYQQLISARERERHALGALPSSASKALLVTEQSGFDWLATALAQRDCQLLTAADGPRALDLYLRERAHVVVVDGYVLNSSGRELVRRLRALDPIVPIILLSSGLDTELHRQLIQDMDPYAIHHQGDADERLIEIVESALGLTRRLARARADQDLRTLILAKFSHDIRNVIHAVHGYTEILRDDPSLSAAGGVLTRLGAAAEAALGLVQHYLDLARLESPGLTVRREPVDLGELLTDLRTLAQRAIGTRPLQLATSIPLSGAVLYTDGEKLRAILAEVLTNAIKFSSEGEVRLDVRITADSTQFVVQDRGPGIDLEDLPILFDAFRQRAGDVLTSTPGQGLGLAIALRLSALLGGRLTAERNPRGGAVFTLSLPVVAELGERRARLLH